MFSGILKVQYFASKEQGKVNSHQKKGKRKKCSVTVPSLNLPKCQLRPTTDHFPNFLLTPDLYPDKLVRS
jgi:hypothetical protein